MDPVLGPRGMVGGSTFGVSACRFQATAVWQWANYYGTQIPDGKSVLRVNLDETAVCLFQGGSKGTIFTGKRRQRGEAFQRVSMGKRRCHITHVALICDRPDLQPVLPQILIGNEHTFLQGSLAALRRSCPHNVRIVRQRSSWNNEVLCAQIIRWLAAALEPYRASIQPVLFLDAARLHLTRRVFLACNAVGVWPIVIPAKLTWLLQPLDTDAFLPFKLRLRQLYQDAQARSVDGNVGVEELLRCLYASIRNVLQGQRWAGAFDKDGLCASQVGVSPRVLVELGIDGSVGVPCTRPTDDQLRHCFPRRSTVPTDVIWRRFGVATAGAGVACASGEDVVVGRGARTRADHRRALAGPSPVAAGPAPVGGAGVGSRLHMALARGRPLVVPRGYRLLPSRGRGRDAGG